VVGAGGTAEGCSTSARRDHDAGTEDRLASAALELINSSSITALFVVEDGRPVGIIHIHNLLRAGVA
jgi:predicted transcriptional regulator